jgi:hypothetical protein
MFDGGDFLRQFFIENRTALSRTMILLSEELEVPAFLISAGFETKTTTIRQIRKRYKSRLNTPSLVAKPAITLEPSIAEARGIRAEMLRKKVLKIARSSGMELLEDPAAYDALQNQINSIFAESVATNHYSEGAARLKRIRDQIGRPGQIDRRRQFADLLRKRAFLLISSGMCASGISDAQHAAWLFFDVFKDSGDNDDLREVINCGLLMGNGYNLRAEPEKTHELLRLLNNIWDSLGSLERPNGDFYRLQGVANLQQTRLQDAIHSFDESMSRLEKSGQMKGTADWLHHGIRHMEILKDRRYRRPEVMEDVLKTIKGSFGAESLHGSVCTQWAAATWLSLGSPDADLLARREIEKNWHLASRFGHQQTLSALLWLVPDLALESWARTKFIRWVLYENVNRDK